MTALDAQIPIAIPLNTSLIGQPFFMQGAVFDTGAAKGLAFTRGLRFTAGQ